MTGIVYYNPDHGTVSIQFFQESQFFALRADGDEKIVKLATVGGKEIWRTQEITEDCKVDWIDESTLVHVQFWGVDDGVVTIPPNLPEKDQITALLKSVELTELGVSIKA